MTDTKSRRAGLRVPVDAVPRRSAVHDVAASVEPSDRVDSVDIPIDLDDEPAATVEVAGIQVDAPVANSKAPPSIEATSDHVQRDTSPSPERDETPPSISSPPPSETEADEDDKSPAVMLVQDLPPVDDTDQEIDDPLFGIPAPMSAADALAATERALMATAPPAPRASDKPPAPSFPPDPAVPTMNASNTDDDDDDDIDVAAFAFGGQNDVVMSAPVTISVGEASSEEALEPASDPDDEETQPEVDAATADDGDDDEIIMGGEGIAQAAPAEPARPPGAAPRSFLSYVATPSVPPPQPPSEEAMEVTSGEADLSSDPPPASAEASGLGPLVPSGRPLPETTLKTQAVDLEIPHSEPPANAAEDVEVEVEDVEAPSEPVDIPDVHVEVASAPIEVTGSDPEIEIEAATDDELNLDEIEVEEVADVASDPPEPPAAAVNPPAPPAPPALPPPEKRPKGKTSWFEAVFAGNPLRTEPRLSPAEIERQALFIAQSLQLPERAKLLDVGCGEGVQALALAQLGIDVTGVDISEEMVERANADAKTMGVNARFLQGDLRDLELQGEYDAVLCFGTTFGYFDDETNRQVMRRLHRALRPGGYLLLDVVNRDYVIRDQPNLVWFADEGCVCMEETRFNFITSRLHVKRTIVLDDGRQREGGYSFRCYSLHELGQMMHLSGFRVAEISGSEGTKGVFFGDVSPRMIVLAERRRVAPPSTQTSVG